MTFERPLTSAIGGVIGGALGTAFMQGGMMLSGKLPEPMRGPKMNGDPGDFVARKAESFVGAEPRDGAHHAFSSSLHWLYGISWGVGLGAIAPVLRVRSIEGAIAAGAGMGAVCWAAGYMGWLPATNLTEPVRHHTPAQIASSLGMHVVYGVLASLPIYLAERLFAPRLRRFGWLAKLIGVRRAIKVERALT